MNKDIVCIGAGYIGGPTMAVIAKMNPDRKVIVVDINEKRIAAWNSADFDLPIYEPGLVDVVREVRGKNLFFSTDIEAAVKECDIIFVGVNTPTKMFGKGAGRASDLQYWESTARNIKAWANGPKIVVEKSTLPVRTAAAMEAILNAQDARSEVKVEGQGQQRNFTVLSNPEFLAEGTAIKDLMNPDRVLIGGPQDAQGQAAVDAVVEIYEGAAKNWVPREKILTTNVWSAELTKLAANAFLAQRVSSINAIAGLCEATGADVDEVAKVMGADHRIGPKFLKAGPGFGGSCFKKDVLNLVYLCESFGLHTAAEYWHEVIKMNDHQQERIVSRLFKAMFNTLANKKIAIFGFAFKADTGDTRETPAGTVVRLLHDEHVRLAITDPKALANAKKDLADLIEEDISTGGSDSRIFKQAPIEFTEDEYAAARDADAIVVMTDWCHYPTLDWARLYASMRKPALVFDTRNCLDSAALKGLGFKVLQTGK
ncbi:MAG: nucleotide sugar dehydrogenase [Kiritimatiellae bacterium]|nr:nucleotide sugar dehydrogenase [Kiritimatiellia bacterium]